jgi:hypothetical protein
MMAGEPPTQASLIWFHFSLPEGLPFPLTVSAAIDAKRF